MCSRCSSTLLRRAFLGPLTFDLVTFDGLTQPLPCPTAKQESILRAPSSRDAYTQMLAPGATIFGQDGMLQSADVTKRWCGTGARFPKQPSHSQSASISFLVGRICARGDLRNRSRA